MVRFISSLVVAFYESMAFASVWNWHVVRIFHAPRLHWYDAFVLLGLATVATVSYGSLHFDKQDSEFWDRTYLSLWLSTLLLAAGFIVGRFVR